MENIFKKAALEAKEWRKNYMYLTEGENEVIFNAYYDSLENENSYLVVKRIDDVAKFVKVLRENGATEFVYAGENSNAVSEIGDLCEAGCKVVSKKVVNDCPNFMGGYNTTNGLLIIL